MIAPKITAAQTCESLRLVWALGLKNTFCTSLGPFITMSLYLLDESICQELCHVLCRNKRIYFHTGPIRWALIFHCTARSCRVLNDLLKALPPENHGARIQSPVSQAQVLNHYVLTPFSNISLANAKSKTP